MVCDICKWAVAVIVLLLTCGCGGRGDEAVKLVEIDASGVPVTEVRLSSIAEGDPVEIALGKMPEGMMIRSINQVEISDGNVFVLDPMIPAVYLFSLDGTFVRRIGAAGRGPGEYVRLMGMAVDSASRSIYVLDSRKLLRYGFDGKLMKGIPQKNAYNYIRLVGGKVYEYLADVVQRANNLDCHSHFRILDKGLTNEIGKLDFGTVTVPYQTVGIAVHNDLISEVDNGYYVYNSIMPVLEDRRDTLYRLTDSGRGMIPEFVVKFDQSKYTSKSFKMNSVCRSNRFIFADYNDAGSFVLCHDLKTGESQITKGVFMDDLCNTGNCSIRLLKGDLFWFAEYPDTETLTNPIIYIGRLKSL